MLVTLQVLSATVFSSTLFSSTTLAKTLPASDAENIPRMTRQVIANSFPELQDKHIEHRAFVASDVFFTSNVVIPTLFGGPVTYLVNYNPRILELNCPTVAIEGILAHELSHTLDYVKGGIPALLEVLNAIRLPLSNQRYERHTDLQAIFRGYGEGLIAYRQWIYPRLTPSELREKRRNYYTPEEIQLIMTTYQQQPVAEQKSLEQLLLQTVPLNLNDLRKTLVKSGMVRGL